MPPDRAVGRRPRVRRADAPHVSDWRGFRVDWEGGRVGVVAVVRRDACSGRPAQLLVRAGRIGTRVLVIAADDVDVVLPESRSLVLRRSWKLLATGASV